MKCYVADTSVIIDGIMPDLISTWLNEGPIEIIVPIAVLDELQAQASKGRDEGFIGLEQLKKLREKCEETKTNIKFEGGRPSLEDIKLARSGRIDAIIRDVARSAKAVLVTADYVQALVAEAEGVQTSYHRPPLKKSGFRFESYFTSDTMSLHIKENVVPMAKRGLPGRFALVKLGETLSTPKEIEEMAKEVEDVARLGELGSVEIRRSGATVIQLGQFRIAISRPPFSDGIEMTVVRPIVKLSLDDYHLSSKLIDRLKNKAEGVVIAGPPGSGKTTLAGSLAEFYITLGKIVKTFESPRDLQVSPEVTQYGPLEGDFEKTSEILLLVRPDFTIYDEVRKTKDFEIFADMRLAGVGMIGVVHASNPVDAVQRFISRVELGMIPHILDTVIFVKEGMIKSVYSLELTVKVPTGMTEADLARPVVEIIDFETGDAKFEIYTFGEETVIVDVKGIKQTSNAMQRLAEERILQVIRRFDPNAKVEIVSPEKVKVYVDREAVPKLIGKGGSMIEGIETQLGITIDVESKLPSLGQEVGHKVVETGNSIELLIDSEAIGKPVNIYLEDEYLLTATVGKKGAVRVSKTSEIGRRITTGLMAKQKLRVMT
jgi:ATPase